MRLFPSPLSVSSSLRAAQTVERVPATTCISRESLSPRICGSQRQLYELRQRAPSRSPPVWAGGQSDDLLHSHPLVVSAIRTRRNGRTHKPMAGSDHRGASQPGTLLVFTVSPRGRRRGSPWLVVLPGATGVDSSCRFFRRSLAVLPPRRGGRWASSLNIRV